MLLCFRKPKREKKNNFISEDICLQTTLNKKHILVSSKNRIGYILFTYLYRRKE